MLGMVAAGAATLFFNAVSNRDKEEKTVNALLAQADLPARTRLTQEHIKVVTVPQRGLPAGYYTNATQAVGKILKIEVSQGQALTPELVISKSSVAELLSPGMLAFSAPVSKRSTSVGLLEPGSIVDIQVTFPLRQSAEGDAVVFTLLQQIRVLGLNQDTVISQNDPKIAQRRSSNSSVVVTLEVSDRQARALGLALKHGTLALPLRNPTDHTFYPVEVMVLKEGRLTAGSKSLDPQDLMLFNQLTQLLGGQPIITDVNTPAGEIAQADPNDPNAVARTPAPQATPASSASAQLSALLLEEDSSSIQKVTIIRAQKVEEVELEVDEEEEAPADEGAG